MERNLLVLAAALTVTACTTPMASASATDSSSVSDNVSSQQVWVAKDVTREFHFSIEYKSYNSDGQLVRDRKVTPPAGSLVEYLQVPISEAIANNENYVVPTVGENQTILATQLDSLHEKLFERLNHGKTPEGNFASNGSSTVAASDASISSSSTAEPMSTPPDSRTYVSSSFTNFCGTSWNYTVFYDTIAYYPNLNVYTLSISQAGPGTSYLDHSTWNGQSKNWGDEIISRNSSSPTNQNFSWEGAPGSPFTTYVIDGGVAYSGYSTLS